MRQHRRWASALVLALGLSFAFEALGDEVDWSEYMEPPSSARPRARADEEASAKPGPARRVKRAKDKRAKKQARARVKRRAARNGRRR